MRATQELAGLGGDVYFGKAEMQTELYKEIVNNWVSGLHEINALYVSLVAIPLLPPTSLASSLSASFSPSFPPPFSPPSFLFSPLSFSFLSPSLLFPHLTIAGTAAVPMGWNDAAVQPQQNQ